MPIQYAGYGQQRRRTCSRRVTWSIYRGGCRFAPNHAGACKPTPGKR